MRYVCAGIAFFAATVIYLASGYLFGSKASDRGTHESSPTLYIASSEKGFPRVSLKGDAMLQYKQNLYEMSLTISKDDKTASGKVDFHWKDGNNCMVRIEYLSDMPLKICFLGFTLAETPKPAEEYSECAELELGANTREWNFYCQSWHEF